MSHAILEGYGGFVESLYHFFRILICGISQMWMGSNLTPIESFVLCLQDQIHDLQHQWMSFQKEWGVKQWEGEMLYKYIYVRFYIRGENEREVERRFLRLVFGEQRLEWVRFAVWKITPVLDDTGAFEIRAGIQWGTWIGLAKLSAAFTTMDTTICLKCLNGFDGKEAFIESVEGWGTDGRVWRRGSLEEPDVEQMIGSLDALQKMFLLHWSREALYVWLWESVDE